MQVILMDKVVNLGNLGDVVKVKDGYARNFLIPTGRARRATQANLETFAAQKAELERIAAEKLADAIVAHGRETGQTPAARASSPNRFRDNDCLRYSLRSVHRHAPWVERIHIVTAGERPGWLVPDHPSIRLVRHDEIFPGDGALPTFNSHAIEACLHRIDGVSERFLYFNDDLFLTADLDLGYFAWPDGSPRFSLQTWQMFSDPLHPSPVAASAAYSRRLLDARFGRRLIRRETPHEPILLDRAVLETMEREWPHEFGRTRRNRLRPGRAFVVTRLELH